MLLPFSIECETVPVLALAPWNIADVWWPAMCSASVTLAASTAVSAKTDNQAIELFHFRSPLSLLVYCSTICTACPSGSRTIIDFRNPAFVSGSATTPVEMKADRAFRRLCAASSALIPENLVCQWIRSLDLLLQRIRPTVAGRQVFQELNAWPAGCSQRRDMEARAEHVVQVLLFGSVSSRFHQRPAFREHRDRISSWPPYLK